MVDIHSHILPGVDDGAENLKEALEMAALAWEGGTKKMIVTPHCNIPGMFNNYYSSGIQENFELLKQELKSEGIPLEIYLGAEIFGTNEFPVLLEQGKLRSLNGGRYMLIEFDFGQSPYFMEDLLSDALYHGIVPVVAHPERYFAVQEYPEIVYRWIEKGCIIQVNKGSVLGRFGRGPKRTAGILLEEELVHVLASDAHSSVRRTPWLEDIWEYMYCEFSEEYAELLLKINPERIINDQEIIR